MLDAQSSQMSPVGIYLPNILFKVPPVNLPAISKIAHTLVQSLYNERNLSHIVDILLVSDHRMEGTSSWGMVYLDDIFCHDARDQGWLLCRRSTR